MPALMAQHIIDRFRAIAKDTNTDKNKLRWADDEILRWISDGQREMISLRPDMYCSNDNEYALIPIPPLSTISHPGTDLNIHSANVHILLDYVCARAFEKDAEEGDLKMSQSFMSQFYSKLKQV